MKDSNKFDTKHIKDWEINTLTKEDVLSKVSEEDIFRKYISSFQELKKAFRSELREDLTPTCKVYPWGDSFRYKDFAEDQSLDCFGYVQKLYNCSFSQALRIISSDFNLNLVSPSYRAKSTRTIQEPESEAYSTLKIKRRDWTKDDKVYWGRYHLDTDFLDQNYVKSISHYWVNKENREYHFFTGKNLAYSYDEFGHGIRKLYFPYSNFRFLGNAKDHNWFGFDFLPWIGDKLVITKSSKDRLIWSKMGFNCTAVQGEACIITEDRIEALYKRFKTLYINYDTDALGRKMSQQWASKYSLEPIFVPESFEGKDMSDFMEKNGPNETLNLMKKCMNLE